MNLLEWVSKLECAFLIMHVCCIATILLEREAVIESSHHGEGYQTQNLSKQQREKLPWLNCQNNDKKECMCKE